MRLVSRRIRSQVVLPRVSDVHVAYGIAPICIPSRGETQELRDSPKINMRAGGVEDNIPLLAGLAMALQMPEFSRNCRVIFGRFRIEAVGQIAVSIAQHAPPLLNDISRHWLTKFDVTRSFPEALPA